jgi:hypothetical protein
MNEIAIAIYVVVALAGALLLMSVIFQASNDLHLNRTDHPSIIKARKNAFFGDAIFLTLTVVFREYWLVHPSVIATGLVAAGLVGGGIMLLVVNVISLHMRAPPPSDGHRAYQASSIWRLRG